MNNRSGIRKARGQSSKLRKPQLGYYIIVTDTKDTEKNYLYGLRDSIPKELQGKLTIKVSNEVKASKLVDEICDLRSKHPQYCEPWIIFDRDQVGEFDETISEAESKCIHVGWSNPCIEIWFSAYFNMMPTFQNSVECCKGFEKLYKNIQSKITVNLTARYIQSYVSMAMKKMRLLLQKESTFFVRIILNHQKCVLAQQYTN